MMNEHTGCCDEAANHQLPIAAAFWIIQVVTMEERSSLMQTLMQILCSARPVILNVTATQHTHSLNCIYSPQWLVQWGCHYSQMCIAVHCPWLPGYIDVAQTILVYIKMVGFFLNRLCRSSFTPPLPIFSLSLFLSLSSHQLWSEVWSGVFLYGHLTLIIVFSSS